jgi:quinol monooxygenase YgiN
MHLKFALILAAMLPLAAGSAPRAQNAAANAPSSDPTVYVVNYIDAAATAKGQVVTLLKQLAQASSKEPGVLRFEVLQRVLPQNEFAIIEAWKDQAALDAHIGAAAAKQFNDKLSAQLIAPVDSRSNRPFAVGPVDTKIPAGALYGVTHIDVNPPNMDDENGILKTFAEATRKAPGNLRFDATVQLKGRGNHYTVFEAWKDQKSLEAHAAAAGTKSYRTTHAPLSGALFDQRWYKAL